jgi:hypothetical protein
MIPNTVKLTIRRNSAHTIIVYGMGAGMTPVAAVTIRAIVLPDLSSTDALLLGRLGGSMGVEPLP